MNGTLEFQKRLNIGVRFGSTTSTQGSAGVVLFKSASSEPRLKVRGTVTFSGNGAFKTDVGSSELAFFEHDNTEYSDTVKLSGAVSVQGRVCFDTNVEFISSGGARPRIGSLDPDPQFIDYIFFASETVGDAVLVVSGCANMTVGGGDTLTFNYAALSNLAASIGVTGSNAKLHFTNNCKANATLINLNLLPGGTVDVDANVQLRDMRWARGSGAASSSVDVAAEKVFRVDPF